MTVFAVTGHEGARAWLLRRGLAVDVWLQSLDVAAVKPGDTVAGTLPIPLVALLGELSATYLHLTVPLPAGLTPAERRRELSADDLDRLGAALECFEVRRVPAVR